MAMLRYLKEAFLARPWGMWVPPNLVGLGAFGMLGVLNPGFWVIGAGLELGYLLMLSTSKRFQRVVDAKDSFAKQETSEAQVNRLVGKLNAADQGRYRALEKRCQDVLENAKGHGPEHASVDVQAHAEGLGRLLFVYLKLLLTRSAILHVLEGSESGMGKTLDRKIADVTRQLNNAETANLKKSLTDQLEILEERKKRHAEAREKLTFIEAELTRIQEQVELIREGLVITSDPDSLSRRIDQIGDTLGSTSQWIRQQQELYGATEELLSDPPPVVLEARQAQ
jgi:hypothetical protein